MSMKSLSDKVAEELAERMGSYTDSRQPSDDEVSMAALVCRVQELEEALKPFAEVLGEDLSSVGGGTLCAPTFKVQAFKDALMLLGD